MSPTAAGPGGAVFNSYPLVHGEGVYDGLIDFKPGVRPFILTRAGFPGIQRTASALWSGDVVSRWDDLREQIAAGVNLSMSGIPNWTHDIGGFSNEARYTNQDPAHLDEWRELNTRWFQFGAFTPLFRSHGEFPRREVYEIAPEGSPTYRSMQSYLELRYRLMPYIYTVAADTYHRDGSIMRALAMDFPGDRAAWNHADQFLFGPAFMVAPVTRFKARSRPVYLPAGTLWYDFHSGRSIAGGRTIEADAPYERMPVFVRAGSIVPSGPQIQHTGEGQGAPITLHVFTGANGAFSLYEDDGVSRDYLNGAFARIPLRYDETNGILTIGAREGSYLGQAKAINVRWVRPGRNDRPDFVAPADVTIAYDGSEQQVRLAR
jgi:alpha-D-xyloside xylohydrolase